MSMPHLDTRVIDGKDWLLFGPFAGWSPKFLKTGKVTDLPLSVKPDNLLSMIGVGLTELSLLKYLIGELLQSFGDRVDTLRQFAPTAQGNDWETRHRRTARPGDPARLQEAGCPGVRHNGSGRRRRIHRRAARRLAGCLHRGAGDDRRDAAVLPRRLPRLGAEAQGDGALAGSKLSDEPRLFAEVWDHGTRVLGPGEPLRRSRVTVALRRAWARDLDAPTLYALLRLRVEVFVVEQTCPYPELDGRDLEPQTRHFWLESPAGE